LNERDGVVVGAEPLVVGFAVDAVESTGEVLMGAAGHVVTLTLPVHPPRSLGDWPYRTGAGAGAGGGWGRGSRSRWLTRRFRWASFVIRATRSEIRLKMAMRQMK